MVALRNRRVDRAGQVVFDDDGLVELLYEGFGDFAGLLVEPSPEIDAYNTTLKRFAPKEQPLAAYAGEPEDMAAYDAANRRVWHMPDRYRDLDVRALALGRCRTPEEVERVELEMRMFAERGMDDVLRFLVYFVDHLRANNVLWGLGRGSSVASYVLYLLGVHKINSLKFNLDIGEFLK